MFHDGLNLDAPTHATHVVTHRKDHVDLLLLMFLGKFAALLALSHKSHSFVKKQALYSYHIHMVVKERAEIANRWLLTNKYNCIQLAQAFFQDHKKCNEKRLRNGLWLSEDEHVIWIFWTGINFSSLALLDSHVLLQTQRGLFHSQNHSFLQLAHHASGAYLRSPEWYGSPAAHMAGVWQHVNMAAVVVFLKGVLFIWICVHHLIPPSHNTQLPKKLQLGFGGVGCFFVYMSVLQLVTSTVQWLILTNVPLNPGKIGKLQSHHLTSTFSTVIRNCWNP